MRLVGQRLKIVPAGIERQRGIVEVVAEIGVGKCRAATGIGLHRARVGPAVDERRSVDGRRQSIGVAPVDRSGRLARVVEVTRVNRRATCEERASGSGDRELHRLGRFERQRDLRGPARGHPGFAGLPAEDLVPRLDLVFAFGDVVQRDRLRTRR